LCVVAAADVRLVTKLGSAVAGCCCCCSWEQAALISCRRRRRRRRRCSLHRRRRRRRVTAAAVVATPYGGRCAARRHSSPTLPTNRDTGRPARRCLSVAATHAAATPRRAVHFPAGSLSAASCDARAPN